MTTGAPRPYTGLPYNPQLRASGPIDMDALSKAAQLENPVWNRTLFQIIERLNSLSASVSEMNAREAHDIPYTSISGERTSVGDFIDAGLGSLSPLLNDDGIICYNGDGQIIYVV